MKNYLKNLIQRKKDEMKELQKRSDESTDITEVRSIGEKLTSLRDEISEAEAQLALLGKDDEEDETDPNDEVRNKTFHGVKKREYKNDNVSTDDNTNSIEYRRAFMEYACRNVQIPTELRENQITTTSDASAVIPTTILNEIIKKAESYGNLFSKVRKLNVQGGIQIPILSLKPVANWITEAKSSDDQKIQTNSNITFSYYGLEVKIAQTLLTSVTTLDMFENLFIDLATEALVKAIEIAIIKGTGSGQMLGVTVDTRVPEENVIEIAETDFTWKNLKKKVFAKMKKAYRDGEFFMAQGTFDSYIDGMEDTTGQPVGRVNYGIDGEEKYRFAGKTVETVEDDVIADFDTAEEGEVIGVFMKLSNYAINSNMQMTVNHWIDHDTNTIKDQVILICDGKLIDPNGVLILKKKKNAV